MLKNFLKKILELYKRRKTLFLFLAILPIVLLSSFFVYRYTSIKPNDYIFLLDTQSKSIFANENPTFSINFGKRDEPEKQWIRFESKSSTENPFKEKDESFFKKIASFFKPQEKYGIEMSLRGVKLSETEKLSSNQEVEQIRTVAEILGTDSIETSTQLVDSGRVIGEDSDEAVAKKTIINEDVASGIDLEYQIIEGIGLKEEIVIRNLDEYANSCKDDIDNCRLPLNEFVFDLSLDQGLVLKNGWFNVDGTATETYYFEDTDGNYVAHFLPSFAVDGSGVKTNDVALEVIKNEEGNYETKVTVDINWLLESDRVFPVRIDPSIVHYDQTDFDSGMYVNTKYTNGMGVGLFDSYSGEYISSILEPGVTSSDVNLSYIASGLKTGDGETPYSTTELVAQWNLNESSGATSASEGNDISNSNLSLRNFGSTTSQDTTVGSGWTFDNRRWGNGALMLDGVDDYLTCSDGYCGGISNLDIGERDWSISSWVNTNNSSRQIIVGKGSSNTQYSYSLETGVSEDGKPSFILYNTENGYYMIATGDSSVNDTLWHYIVGTYDGTTISIYVDGILRGTSDIKTGTQVVDSSSDFEIGARNGSTLLFDGIIDSTSIYSRKLSSAEILSNYNVGSIEFQVRGGNSINQNDGTWSDWSNTSNETVLNSFDNPYLYNTTDSDLISYFPMDESDNGTISDAIGNYTGTVTGTEVVDGKYSLCRQFNGTTDYITLSSGFDDFSTGLTVEFWANPTAISNNAHFIDLGELNNVGESNILFYRYGTTSDLVVSFGNDSLIATKGIIENEWHHYVATIDTLGYSTIYRDGVVIASGTISIPVNISRTNNYIGKSNTDTDSLYQGMIDELRIYNTSLSADRVENQYFLGFTSLTGVYKQESSGIKLEGTSSSNITSRLNEGLVSYWSMDESSEDVVIDSFGDNTGTAIGSISSDGKYGYGRYFDGIDDYIKFPNVPFADMSLSFWIYPTSWSNEADTVLISEKDTDSSGFLLFVSNQLSLNWDFGDSTNNYRWDIGYLPPLNTWTNIVLTKDSNGRYLYVNGELESTTTVVGGDFSNSSDLRFGSDESSSVFYEGSMDEIKLYDVAKTPEEISFEYVSTNIYANYNLSSSDLSNKISVPVYIAADRIDSNISAIFGETAYSNYQTDVNTVGLWHLNEKNAIGQNIQDSSGNGNNGLLNGTEYSKDGRLGGGRSFNGISDYISVSDSLSLNPSAITLETWVKPSTLQNCNLISKGNDTSYGLVLLADGAIQFSNQGDTNSLLTKDSLVNPNVWTHIAATGDTSGLKIYINGILVASNNVPYISSITTDPLLLGSTEYNGSLDEIRISNIARNPDQIRQAYEIDLRTLDIHIDFGAELNNSNLVESSSDTSFTVDATSKGLSEMGSNLYAGDKIIIKETVTGIKYIAQGTVLSIDQATGATIVANWDSDSTFPNGGFTNKSNVFKWQKEYISMADRTIDTQVETISLLTVSITNGYGGEDIWIDDMRSNGGYFNVSGESIDLGSVYKYFQYKAVFTTTDNGISAYLNQVQLDYEQGGPSMEQIMRHGKWFSNGVKQNYWWTSK